MAIESSEYDAIGEWDAANPGNEVGTYNVEAGYAIQEAIDEADHVRKKIYVRAPQSGDSDPDHFSEKLTWLIEETLSLPARDCYTLFGTGGAAAAGETGENKLGAGTLGCVTVLCATDDFDLNTPLIETKARRLDMSGLYLRGAFDTDTHGRPVVGIQQSSGAGVANGWSEFRDIGIDGFQTGIKFGTSGTNENCECNRVVDCTIQRCDVGVQSDQDQAHMTRIINCDNLADVAYRANGGGPWIIEQALCRTSDQIVFQITKDNKSKGCHMLMYPMMDSQADDSILLDVDDANASRNGQCLVVGLQDSRVLTKELIADREAVNTFRLHGNYNLILFGGHGCGNILCSGGTDSYGVRHLPTITFVCFEFYRDDGFDPRTLLRKRSNPDVQAERGVDYEDINIIAPIRGGVYNSSTGNVLAAANYSLPWRSSEASMALLAANVEAIISERASFLAGEGKDVSRVYWEGFSGRGQPILAAGQTQVCHIPLAGDLAEWGKSFGDISEVSVTLKTNLDHADFRAVYSRTLTTDPTRISLDADAVELLITVDASDFPAVTTDKILYISFDILFDGDSTTYKRNVWTGYTRLVQFNSGSV